VRKTERELFQSVFRSFYLSFSPCRRSSWRSGTKQPHGFVVEPGDYQIMVGASSADIRDEKLVAVAG
jgi:hypothetical protein